MRPGDDLERLFARIARFYDLQLPLERPALRRAARLAGSLEGERVLDLACGTGAFAEEALKQGGVPAELVLVDREPRLLARARRRLTGRVPAARLRVVHADARSPALTGGFDLVLVGYLLHLLDRREAGRVVAAVQSLLSPGGRAVFVLHAPECARAGAGYRRTWNALAGLLVGVLPAIRTGVAELELATSGWVLEEDVCQAGVYPSRIVLVRPGSSRSR